MKYRNFLLIFIYSLNLIANPPIPYENRTIIQKGDPFVIELLAQQRPVPRELFNNGGVVNLFIGHLPSGHNWGAYELTVLLLNLGVTPLAVNFHHRTPYGPTAHAVVTPDGAQILLALNRRIQAYHDGYAIDGVPHPTEDHGPQAPIRFEVARERDPGARYQPLPQREPPTEDTNGTLYENRTRIIRGHSFVLQLLNQQGPVPRELPHNGSAVNLFIGQLPGRLWDAYELTVLLLNLGVTPYHVDFHRETPHGPTAHVIVRPEDAEALLALNRRIQAYHDGYAIDGAPHPTEDHGPQNRITIEIRRGSRAPQTAPQWLPYQRPPFEVVPQRVPGPPSFIPSSSSQ